MSSHRTTRAAGFSLVELAVAFTVLAVLLGLLVQAVNATLQLSSSSLASGQVDEAAGQALLSLGADLRWAQLDTMLITTDNAADRVDFVIAQGWDGTDTVWSTPIAYRYVPGTEDVNGNGTLDEGQLVRVQDGRTRVICRNVERDSLAITLTDESVELGLTVLGTANDGQVLRGRARTTVTLVNGG